MKNPTVVAIINALIPGAGYLILGRRTVFGGLMLVSTLAFMTCGFMMPEQTSFFMSTTQSGKVLESIAVIAAALGFGYDAYTLAKGQ